MKPGLRCLPNEVWMDIFIFPWISRKQLGKIVHKLGNPTIVEILQYILHKRGKRTLGKIRLDKDAIIPRTSIPQNIRSFECIEICHLDSSTLDFLHQLSGLLNGVNLDFSSVFAIDDLTKLCTILGYLTPLLHGIHSLDLNQSAIPLVQQFFGPNLAQVKMLTIGFRDWTNINFCMDWLTSDTRDPAEPRFLKLEAYLYTTPENFQQFSQALQQQFLSAKNPCTFAIQRTFRFGHYNETEFHLKNSQGEQLDGQLDEATRHFRIYRHKAEHGARARLEEWVRETAEKSGKTSIVIGRHVTIGQLSFFGKLMRMLTSWRPW